MTDTKDQGPLTMKRFACTHEIALSHFGVTLAFPRAVVRCSANGSVQCGRLYVHSAWPVFSTMEEALRWLALDTLAQQGPPS